MAIRRPPQHHADAVPLYICSTDDAWDDPRIAAEREALKKEGGRHCLDVYYSGDTRYDLDAPHTAGGTVVTARNYLREGSTPTVFHLRRVSGLRRSQAIAVWHDDRERQAAQWDLCRYGIVKVTEGIAGTPWDFQGGMQGQPLTDADLQVLYDVGMALPTLVGVAVLHASAPLSDTEGRP